MNNNDDEYVTIKQFSKLVGVTPQAIYKRLSTSLKPFIKQVENKKLINIDALEVFTGGEVEQPLNQNIKQVEQPLNQNIKQVEQPLNPKEISDIVETLNKTIDLLNKQLETKDKQLESLNNNLINALRINENQQILLKNEQDKNKQLEDKGTPYKESFFSRFKKH